MMRLIWAIFQIFFGILILIYTFAPRVTKFKPYDKKDNLFK